MKRVLFAAWALTASAGCGDGRPGVPEGGASIYVLFDERHGLEGGELVRLHEFDIGVVQNVNLSASRVRAEIDLSPEALENLTEATTFTVEDDDGVLFIETHVLDPEADPVAEGTTFEGSDSSLELIAKRARAAAGSLVDDAAASEWWSEASEALEELKKDLDAIDWSNEEKELREQWRKTVDELDDALEHGREETARQVDELVKKLEEVGRSEEAQKIKERFSKLLDRLDDEPGR